MPDCENYMTPARASRLAARKLAAIRIAQRAALEAWEQAERDMHGVLPAQSAKHHKAHGSASWIGGILLTDGSVHLFDRDDMEHADYCASIGVHVVCGSDSGSDGWAFYVNPEGPLIGSGYTVPEQFHGALETVVSQLIH